MRTNDERASAERPDVDAARFLLNGAIVDVVLAAAAARCCFAKALGLLPDARSRDLAPGLLDALAVGRPVAAA